MTDEPQPRENGYADLRADVARLVTLHTVSDERSRSDLGVVAQAIADAVSDSAEERKNTARRFDKLAEVIKLGLGEVAREGREAQEKSTKEWRESNAALYRRLDSDRKTPWAPVAIAATILLGIGTLGLTSLLAIATAFGSQYRNDLTRVETHVEDLTRIVIERIQMAEYHRGQNDTRVMYTENEFGQLFDWNRQQKVRFQAIEKELAKQAERDRLGERPTFGEER